MKRWPYMLILAVLIAGVASSSIHNIPRIAEARMPMVIAAGGAAVEDGGTTLAFVASTNTTDASTTSAVGDTPTGTTENDLMLALITRYDDEEPATPDADWTRLAYYDVAANFKAELYYRLASGSEPADHTWTYSKTVKTKVVICTYRGGFDTADIFDAYSNTTYTTSDTTVRAATVSATATDSALLVIGGFYIGNTDTTATMPSVPNSSWDEDFDSYNFTSDMGAFFYSQTWSSSGATGSMDVTVSNTTADEKTCIWCCLKP
jgi:hypothetical protein